jgi:glycosyltransferase involved in cell wall biosynthesis
LFIVPISKSLVRDAPRQLKPIILKHVHNGVDPRRFPFVADKSDYFITLGRFSPDKGWAIAARICSRLGCRLRLAGIVGNMKRPKQVLMELTNPLSPHRNLADFKYFNHEVFPYLEEGLIEYVGDLAGQNKLDFIGHARALLFPVQWDEPFGMVAIEALACGTPVVAMARGALPEIIEHGVNGFLAHDEAEFEHYMQRIDEIDPRACRKSVEDKFSARHMAEEYLRRFEQVLRLRHGATVKKRVGAPVSMRRTARAVA